MEENNNNNNNQTFAPVTPETSATNLTEVHSAPSLVIEDNASEGSSVTTETPEAPVVSVLETPATPVTPVVPVEPVTQTVTPVQASTVPTENTVTPNGTANEEAKTKPVKKNHNIVALIIIVACLAVAVVYFLSKKNDTPAPAPNPTPNVPVTPPVENDLNSLSLNQASLNGVTFTFPEMKASFNNVGWTWEASYAQNNVEPGMGTNGGRLGTAPGGASVLVINKGTAPAHVEDCTIYSATFYNPKDGSENVTFVGGLVYTSSSDAVKTRMTELGYKKANETINQNTLSLKYFLNDDKTNTNDYVEFYFVDNIMETVTISTAV